MEMINKYMILDKEDLPMLRLYVICYMLLFSFVITDRWRCYVASTQSG